MDITVLAGGLSAERDVSFRTGELVAKALRENGHRVILLDVFMGYKESETDVTDIFSHSVQASVIPGGISEDAPDIAKIKGMRKDQSKRFFGPNVISICAQSDIVFLALHGEDGENGKIQAAFDLFGIRYTGSGYFGSALAMDKGISKMLLERAGIPTPKGIRMNNKDEVKDLKQRGASLPCVVKPCCGGSSVGVSIVRTEADFAKALEEAFFWEEEVIVEDYIAGREFSVGVIEGKALPVIEMAPKEGFYDYKNKYRAGSTVETCPAEIPEETAQKMQRFAEAAVKALGLCTYARMDFLLKESNEIFCLEANTLPGMTETSLLPQEAKAAGMDFNALCEKVIEISWKKYEDKL